jgi:hypothetical protein
MMAQSISKGKEDSIIAKVLGLLGVTKLLMVLKKKCNNKISRYYQT